MAASARGPLETTRSICWFAISSSIVSATDEYRNNNDNESYNLVTVLELAVGDKTVGSEVAGKAAGLATGACLVGLEQF